MALHVLKPERRTLHGHFSRNLPAVLTIELGDTVRFGTINANWGLEPFSDPKVTRRTFEPRTPGLDDGHALCGPVEVRGAEPGMALEVHIGVLLPGPWGFNSAGGEWPEELNAYLGVVEGGRHRLTWTLDTEAMVGRSSTGHSVALSPFLGVMGMPPSEPGLHPTAPYLGWQHRLQGTDGGKHALSPDSSSRCPLLRGRRPRGTGGRRGRRKCYRVPDGAGGPDLRSA